MAEQIVVDGFQNFMAKIEELEKTGREVYCMFSGSKDAGGNSWCPDCVKAEPVVESCMKMLPVSVIFLHCHVGGRDYWKDKSNDFRVHPKLKLTGVPTLLKWGDPNQKLMEDQLFKPELIEMMFED